MAFELTTFADIKALADLSKSLITDYPSIGVLKPAVEGAIIDYCQAEFDATVSPRTETFFTGSTPTAMIPFRALPVGTITSVTVTTLGEDTSLTENTDYEVTAYGIRTFTNYQNAKFTLVYVGGYAEGSVPAGLSSAALIQTAYEYQNHNHIGAETVSTEGGTVRRPALQLLPEVVRRLQPYVHPLLRSGI